MPVKGQYTDSESEINTDFIHIHSDVFENPVFTRECFSLRGALLWIASKGRVVRVTVGDISREWGVSDRRAVLMVRKLEKSDLVSVSGGGRCRIICIETDLIQTCGFYISKEAQWPVGGGSSKWRGPSLPNKLRAKIIKRDNSTCNYCGTYTDQPHIDHIKPVARGGLDTEKNLTVACAGCNLSKGSKTLEEWRASQ